MSSTAEFKFTSYASVLVDVSVGKLLDYGLTVEMTALAKKGMRVEVPLRGRMQKGYIFAIKDLSDVPKVQPISRLLSDDEIISSDLFELSIWMAKYYCVPLQNTVQMMLPAIVRKSAKHKEQLFVMRAKTCEELAAHCIKIRNRFTAQALVLDVMIKVKKGILLTELLEETAGSKSPIDTLVKQGFLQIDIVRIDRSPLINEEYFKTKPKILSKEQKQALDKIEKTLQEGCFETHLLFGITGSGKTEVYLQAIEKALQEKMGTIMLVPEISLTAQTIERFKSRFEDKIAILHHRLSDGERFDEWHKIKQGVAPIVIGARSAVFSPVKNLGLIIVDEEHENSYKQSDSAPCYHARDIAVMRGKIHSAAVILGSATPSLESFYNASTGKYTLSTLTHRAEVACIPQFTIIDMKKEYEKNKGYTNFSDKLLNGIKVRQEKGEQTILFLNRRGYHTTLLCQSCAKAVRCNHCDVSLTFHLNEKQLACHLCGYTTSPPSQCPSCKSATMKYRGVGTEQIERSLHAILPGIRTLRIDADTTRHKGSHQKLLKEFGVGKADVLIGTQMIAKGLHFPEVTLVGVLNSDNSLNMPDFRASEVTFQLITQVAGRAGRGAIKGEVMVQTSLPDNPIIAYAARQDFEKFYSDEIKVREMFEYPPFSNLAKLTFSGINETATRQFAQNFKDTLLQKLSSDYKLSAIIPSGHAKIKDKFRFQLLIRGPSIYPISKAIELIKETSPSKGVFILIDINPTSTFF